MRQCGVVVSRWHYNYWYSVTYIIDSWTLYCSRYLEGLWCRSAGTVWYKWRTVWFRVPTRHYIAAQNVNLHSLLTSNVKKFDWKSGKSYYFINPFRPCTALFYSSFVLCEQFFLCQFVTKLVLTILCQPLH